MTERFKAQLTTQEGDYPVLVHFQKKSRHRDFAMIELIGLEDFVKRHHLSRTEYRLLLIMVAKMAWDNVVQMSLRELAKELSVQNEMANRAMRQLWELDLVRPALSVGRVCFYMVSPDLVSKVRFSELNSLREKWSDLPRKGA